MKKFNVGLMVAGLLVLLSGAQAQAGGRVRIRNRTDTTVAVNVFESGSNNEAFNIAKGASLPDGVEGVSSSEYSGQYSVVINVGTTPKNGVEFFGLQFFQVLPLERKDTIKDIWTSWKDSSVTPDGRYVIFAKN